MKNTIQITGARQHNLQNISVTIPKDQLVVFTGVSGSGKSSLAFDTIYAEGQRRYVESLSAYARQFLGVMDKPDVDSIEGLSPSISIDQKTATHNPRSTVGTITEIYDFLRLLFARVGHPHCPTCAKEITRLSVDEIVRVMTEVIAETCRTENLKPHVFRIMAPVVRERKGEFKDLIANIKSKGYRNVRIDSREFTTDQDISLLKQNKHTIEVLIDTISSNAKDMNDEVYRSNLHTRLAQAIEQSFQLTDGLVYLVSATESHLYSEKFSCATCNVSLPELEPRMFSFNSPIGACVTCRGIGTVHKVDPDSVINWKLSINEGGIVPFTKFYFLDTWYTRLIRTMAQEEGIGLDVPIGSLNQEQIDMILHGTKNEYRVRGTNRQGKPTAIVEKFDGIVAEIERKYHENTGEYNIREMQKYMREEICETCLGSKLKPEVLAVTVDKRNIAEFSDKSVVDLFEYAKSDMVNALNNYERQIADPILKEIGTRLSFLVNVGLGYLTISRTAKTLSGGELQRIRLASQIGSGLTGVLYVLDEPSIGLHPRDVSALLSTLQKLRDLGNTLIVVEHDKETIEMADHVIELGPAAGKHGGHVLFSGTVAEMENSKTSVTGPYLKGTKSIEIPQQKLSVKQGDLLIKKASEHNLKEIDIRIPLGNLIAVTGVSGSGKSTLVVDTLYPAVKYHVDGYYNEHMGAFQRLEGFQHIDRVYLVDQSPIGRTPRSNPATYVGLFDEVRDLFATTVDARMRGMKKGRFSFNVKGGRCEKCQGAGVIKIEMQFLPDVYVTCDVCEGKRYNKETLEVKYKGRTIYEILRMTVEEGCDFFRNHPKIYKKLEFLKQVGLDYIELGQPAPTFSGGEAQRIKLADELSRTQSGRTLYILDEPTTGLHFADVQKLLDTLYQLVARGNTVVVIEHNLDVIKNSQYIIDLGPGGGDAGGSVVYQGELSGIVDVKTSHTAAYLKPYLK